MPLRTDLEARLSKKFEPDSRVEDQFRGKDMTITINKTGDAVTLFLGKRQPDGIIVGERYVRRIVYAPDQTTVLKSHWELKGKVSRS